MAVAVAVMGGVASGDPIPEDARPVLAAEAGYIERMVRRIRKDFPQYADWSDAELRAALSAKFSAEQANVPGYNPALDPGQVESMAGISSTHVYGRFIDPDPQSGYGSLNRLDPAPTPEVWTPRVTVERILRLRQGSVADRVRATGFAVGDGDTPPLSDENIVARVEAIDDYFALSIVDILCSMAAEVEYGILELSGATRGKGRGVGNILAGEPDKNVYATTLKAAKLSRDLRKEAEERGGSCDAAHSAAGRISLR